MIKAIAFLSTIASASISTCGTGLFKVNSMSFSPDPPIKGQNSTLSITYTNPGNDIIDGSVKYSFNYNGIPYSQSDTLCSQVECPITTGEHTEISSALWDGSLSGKIATTIQWYDTTNTMLLCIQTVIRT